MPFPDITYLDSARTEGELKTNFFGPILDSGVELDTSTTLEVGYTETPSAYTSGAVNVSSGALRTCDTTGGVTIGLISGNGRVTILLTGGGSVAYDAGYDKVIGSYDSSKSGSIAQVVNDGTNQWIIFSNTEA